MATVSAGIRVEGAKSLRATLKRAGHDIGQLKVAHAKVAGVVVGAGRARAPHLTGRTSGSVRPGATQRAAVVRVGSARLPYPAVDHWGWPARNIKSNPWLSRAAQDTEAAWTPIYERAVESVLATIKGA